MGVSGGRQADKEGCRRGIRGSICLTAAPPHTQERRGAPLVDLFDVKFSSLMVLMMNMMIMMLFIMMRIITAQVRSASCGPPSDRTWLYSPSGTRCSYMGGIQTKSGIDLSNMYRYHSSAPVRYSVHQHSEAASSDATTTITTKTLTNYENK